MVPSTRLSEQTLTESESQTAGAPVPVLVDILALDDLLRDRTATLRLPDPWRGPISVGRDTTALDPVQRDGAIGLPDRFLSGRHFVLERGPAGAILRDEGSKNGTFVNGERATLQPLRDGDLIQAGHSLLCYREVPAAAASLSSRRAATTTFAPSAASVWAIA